jgi:hypothetical protein
MIGPAIILIVLGVLIKNGKMYWLISGYNTMSKSEQEAYDIKALATLFRNVMFVMAFILLSGYLLSKLIDNSQIRNYALWIAVLFGVPYLLIQSNSKKYKKK